MVKKKHTSKVTKAPRRDRKGSGDGSQSPKKRNSAKAHSGASSARQKIPTENQTEQNGPRIGRPPRQWNLPIYDSMNHCEACVGIPVVVQRQAKREGCLAFQGNRVDLALLLQHLFRPGAVKKDGDKILMSGGISLDSPRKDLEKWNAERAKVKALREMEAVIDKKVAEREIAEAIAIMFTELDRVFTSELPPRLAGLEELRIRLMCKEGMEDIKEGIRSRLTAVVKDDKDDEEEWG